MFHVLCGVACAVSLQPAEALEPPAFAAPPPPPPPVFLDQDEGCAVYNCIGPRTGFRLPDEIPYPYYEQQYFGLPPGG